MNKIKIDVHNKIDDSWNIKPKDKKFPTQELAGGVVVSKESGKLLVALVGDKKFSDYILPKGRIETGELPLNAAIREIEEEAGLRDLKFIENLGIKKRLTYRKIFWNTYYYFLFLTDQILGVPKLGPDEKDYFLKWFDIDNLPSMFWPEQRQLIEENREKIKKLIPIT
jgi:8-oxo-dGTP pyrophosphatase MutT (NUDIX family)